MIPRVLYLLPREERGKREDFGGRKERWKVEKRREGSEGGKIEGRENR